MTTANDNSLADKVAALLAEKKMVMLDTLAQTCGVSELQAAEALPQPMRAFAAAADFDAIWADLTAWESATFIMRHGGSVVEIKGQIPAGKHGGGYFNLDHGCPLGGHICSNNIAHMAFLSLPFMGLESHSIQFFDAAGAVVFSIYVGRENRALIPTVKERFLALRTALGKENMQ